MVVDPQPQAVETDSQGRVAKNAIIYFLGQLLSWSVTFLTISLIPRRIGEMGMGQLGVATTVVTTVSNLFALSIDSFLTAEIGRDRRLAERYIRALFGLRLLLFVPMGLTAMLVLWGMRVDSLTLLLGGLGVFAALFFGLKAPIRATLSGWEEAHRVTALDFLPTLYPLLAFPFLRHGPVALMIANLFMSILALGLSLTFIWHRIRWEPVFDSALWRILIIGGLPFLWNNMVIQLYQFGSMFLLRHFASEAAVGEYGQTMRLQGTFLFVPVALGYAMLPSLARLSDASPQEFRRIQSRVLALLISLALPVTTTILFLAEPFCHLLYGYTKFVHVPLALQISAINLIPLYINTVLYNFLVAERKNRIWGAFLTGTVSLHILLCCLLIPWTMRTMNNAPAGAVLSSLIAETITVFLAFRLLGNNPLNRETTGRIFRSLLAAAAMVPVLWYTRHLFILLPAVLGLAVFGGLAWNMHILGVEEQQRIRRMIMGRLGKRH